MNRIIALLFSALFLVCSCKQKQVTNNPRISKLPNFLSSNLSKSDSLVLNMTTNDKTFVMFFSPECEMCEDEIKVLLEKKDMCKDYRFIFITQPVLKDEMPFFLEEYDMTKIPNSIILYDQSMKFHTIFGVSSPPSLFIYDKNNSLVDSHIGATDMNKVIDKKYEKR